MDIFRSPVELNNFLIQQKRKGTILGLVPTMGALHEGHLSIMKRCVSENDFAIASIFVNPIQFNNPSDLQAYPRPIEQDLTLLKDTGCHLVFAPEVSDMYSQPPIINFDFGDMGKVMEGKYRPGHFSGVGIVVSKLLNIIAPDKVYFGLKDFQQVAILKKLVSDLSYSIQIVECDTLRDYDGLALSSRNIRIPSEKRPIAGEIYKTLKNAATSIHQLSIPDIIQNAHNSLGNFSEIRLEYIEIVDFETLMEVHDVSEHSKIVVCIAAYIGDVRLIDNIIVTL